MDEYLEPNKSYLRLLQEYKEYGSLCVGVDFDGTLHDYHNTGADYEQVRQLVRNLKSIGCTIVIWTAHPDHKYVEDFCKKNNIPQDCINTNGIKLNWDSRKPFFSVLLDDRAGLAQVYQELSLLVKTVKKEI